MNEELFAVPPDKAGTNIPRSSCTRGWQLRQEFQLAARSVPNAICPKSVLRSITDKGYSSGVRAGFLPKGTVVIAPRCSERCLQAKLQSPPPNSVAGARNAK